MVGARSRPSMVGARARPSMEGARSLPSGVRSTATALEIDNEGVSMIQYDSVAKGFKFPNFQKAQIS